MLNKNFVTQANQKLKSNKQLIKSIQKNIPKALDEQVHQWHYQIFENINCLECANCCKTTSPIFKQKDIENLSKHLKIKPSEFIQKYLKIDEDNDFVLTSSPCAFLNADNTCTVYEHRPTACKEYPHTNRKKFYQLLELSLKNTLICPAVYAIFENLQQHYGKRH